MYYNNITSNYYAKSGHKFASKVIKNYGFLKKSLYLVGVHLTTPIFNSCCRKSAGKTLY
jgi:hypothetical protein